jgi:hypothetical protein
MNFSYSTSASLIVDEQGQMTIQSQRTRMSGIIEMEDLVVGPYRLIDVLRDYQQQIKTLQTEIDDLKQRMVHVEFAPGGPGFREAKSQFEALSREDLAPPTAFHCDECQQDGIECTMSELRDAILDVPRFTCQACEKKISEQNKTKQSLSQHE